MFIIALIERRNRKSTTIIQVSNLVVARSTRAGGTILRYGPMKIVEVTFMLIDRLERIPADSIWAHRASGIRGALLKTADRLEKNLPISRTALDEMISKSYEILEKGARGKQQNR